MGSCCIQKRSRKTTVKREWTERCGKENKENNDNVWSITPEERCGQIARNEERGKQRSDECGILPFWKKTSSGELMQLNQSILKILLWVENLKNRKHNNLNKTSVKRKCMGSLLGKCQKKLIRIKYGNGYPKIDLKIGTEALFCAAQ